ncbi:hypothetical protein [Trueperella sp. LYQ143]|uniref:hypothetical protein n=1 Tax=unclassified Trueperella TaxID=2630174 RepID=UPI003983C2E8
MQHYENLMGKLGSVFMVAMAVIGWVTLVRVGFPLAILILVLCGSAMVLCGLWGMYRQSPFMVAAGTLGAGILFPTVWGIVPMIVGFILFILMVSLTLLRSMTDDPPRS